MGAAVSCGRQKLQTRRSFTSMCARSYSSLLVGATFIRYLTDESREGKRTSTAKKCEACPYSTFDHAALAKLHQHTPQTGPSLRPAAPAPMLCKLPACRPRQPVARPAGGGTAPSLSRPALGRKGTPPTDPPQSCSIVPRATKLLGSGVPPACRCGYLIHGCRRIDRPRKYNRWV